MERILITGGAGFIGYHLALKLLSKDYKIDLIDDLSRGVNDKYLKEITAENQVKLIDANLLDYKINDELRNDYTYVYHLAAVVGVEHVLKAPYNVLVKNIELLKNAIVIGKMQNKLKRFVFASTSEVYAGTLKNHGLKFPTPENSPLSITNLEENRTPYMLSKIYGEALCIHSSLPFTIIRPHNFYGPRMGLSHVIPQLLKKAYDSKNGKLDVYSVNHKRTFCFIKDAVEMIVLISEKKKSLGETYNIGNQQDEISIAELAKIIIEVVGKDLVIKNLVDSNDSIVRRCPDMMKTINLEAFKINYNLKDGIKRTFDWYRKDIFENKDFIEI